MYGHDFSYWWFVAGSTTAASDKEPDWIKYANCGLNHIATDNESKRRSDYLQIKQKLVRLSERQGKLLAAAQFKVPETFLSHLVSTNTTVKDNAISKPPYSQVAHNGPQFNKICSRATNQQSTYQIKNSIIWISATAAVKIIVCTSWGRN